MPRHAKPDPRLAVAYLRVSTSDQSLEQQRDALTAWAAQQGLTIVAWEADTGVSGTAPVHDRPGLVRALGALREERAGVLVAAARDRLARNVGVGAILEQLAAEAGATIRTVDGRSDDNSIEGRLLRQILDAFAEFEAAKIAIRTRAAHASRRSRGLLASGAPYGYRSEGERPHKRLVPIPHEQAALSRMRQLAAESFTQRQIVLRLAAEGFKPRGKRWQITTVARALRRPSP